MVLVFIMVFIMILAFIVVFIMVLSFIMVFVVTMVLVFIVVPVFTLALASIADFAFVLIFSSIMVHVFSFVMVLAFTFVFGMTGASVKVVHLTIFNAMVLTRSLSVIHVVCLVGFKTSLTNLNGFVRANAIYFVVTHRYFCNRELQQEQKMVCVIWLD
jgi:hypothetical protein